jgi:hypothetical protein
MDFTQYPMGLIGGLIGLFVFGVFITTWWWYGMREMDRRARALKPVREEAAPLRAPSVRTAREPALRPG